MSDSSSKFANILQKHNLELISTIRSNDSTTTMKVKTQTGEIQILKVVTMTNPTLVQYKPLTIENNHFVKYLDYFLEENSYLCYLMEYCDGGSAKSLLKSLSRSLNEREINAIAFLTLQSLSYLHSNSFLHADLKPENILLNHLGELKLSDTSFMNSIFHKKRKLLEPFSPSYCSPQYDSKSRSRFADIGTPNAKYDIWCLGMTLLHLFDTDFALLPENQIPSNINDKCSRLFKNFLHRCLTVDEMKRHSAKKLLKDAYIRQLTPEQAIEIVKSLANEHIMYLEDHEFDICEEEQLSDIEADIVNSTSTPDQA